jgi:inner membrane protein
MDNVCHTLVGAACARAGIARPTRLAAATSMIAANLPDVDVLVFATGIPSVAFRRGWTHGILAQALLPLLLTFLMIIVGRRLARGSPPGSHESAPSFGPLLLLSYVGVLSHVGLDYLNNYGVRLLMPFSDRWFYGDAVFIVDPWLWAIVGAGVIFARKGRTAVARAGLALAAVYILGMLVSARAARTIVSDEWRQLHGTRPRALMVGPVPVDPFRRAVIVDAGDEYRTGAFTWFPRRLTFDPETIRKGAGQAAVPPARADPRVAGILVWSRFPFWTVEPVPGGTRVTVRDVRFAGIGRGGFTASVVVRSDDR